MKPDDLKEKIETAKLAMINGKCYFSSNLDNLVEELMQLNIDNSEDLWPLLISLFSEIKPDHYKGPILSPPFKEIYYENLPKNATLSESFVFSWKSKKLKNEITLKFALNSGNFYFVSLRNGSS
jgi:hypothetical protein